MDEGKQTFFELLIGIALFSVLLVISGLFVKDNQVSYYIGLIVGILLSLLLVGDMYSSLSKALWMEPKKASGYIRKKTILRLTLIIIAFLIAVLVDQIHILGVLLGALTLKFSAYIQPLTHKFSEKLNKGR